MYKMDTKLIKKKLVDKCMELHLTKIRNLEAEMAEAEQSAHEYGQESDIFDSQKMQLIGKRDMYAAQLTNESSLMEILYKVDPYVKNDTVAFGSVVVTDLQKVFIAIGLGKLQFENDTYYAISPQVPFYEAMKGLKKGDSFDFRGRKVKILDVF